MRPLRLVLALLSGSWLYYVAVILVGGYMAALSVPKGYFTYFGPEHREFALAVLSLFTWALPVGGLVCAGFLALQRLLSPTPSRLVSWLALSGMVSSYLLLATSPASRGLWQSFLFPWWAAPNFLAPWAGAALAILLAPRSWVTLGHAHHAEA
jgi:hypothetical protein